MMRFFCGMTNFVYGVTAIFLVALCVLCLPEGRAQLAGALLSGTISDASGASIAGAQLEIKNIENGEVRTVVSNGDGFYSAPNLLPGNYDLSVSANGFAGLTEHGVILKVGMQQKLDLTLTVGEVRQNVEVSSAAPTIDTTTSVVSGQVDEKTIQPFSGIAGTCQNLLGNNGRNQIYGPKLVELDLSLIKNFRVQRISERFGVEFRADAFNVLNHPNFLPPVANNVLGLTSTGSLTGISGAGQISQTATSSRQIQLAVKVIW